MSAIAISHPHFYGSMIECRARVRRPGLHPRRTTARGSPGPTRRSEFWDGETRQIGDGLTLINLGVHFAGGQVLHWAGGEGGAGALMSGDIVTVVPDRRWVSFMYSYPNLIPERPAVVRRALSPARAPYPFAAGLRRLVALASSPPTARPRSGGRPALPAVHRLTRARQLG
mgnify:CR=1 FL=1